MANFWGIIRINEFFIWRRDNPKTIGTFPTLHWDCPKSWENNAKPLGILNFDFI